MKKMCCRLERANEAGFGTSWNMRETSSYSLNSNQSLSWVVWLSLTFLQLRFCVRFLSLLSSSTYIIFKSTTRGLREMCASLSLIFWREVSEKNEINHSLLLLVVSSQTNEVCRLKEIWIFIVIVAMCWNQSLLVVVTFSFFSLCCIKFFIFFFRQWFKTKLTVSTIFHALSLYFVVDRSKKKSWASLNQITC